MKLEKEEKQKRREKFEESFKKEKNNDKMDQLEHTLKSCPHLGACCLCVPTFKQTPQIFSLNRFY
jgi:hypothetical protein